MKKTLILLAAGLAALTPLRAAENIHLFLKGQKSGPIAGDNTDGSIAGLAFEHSIVSPRDPASGLPTGKRMHKPFVIVKSIDKSTPLLYKMLVTNEACPTVKFQFYKPAVQGGKPTLYYTVELTNASIASVRNWKRCRSPIRRSPGPSPMAASAPKTTGKSLRAELLHAL